MSNHELTCPRPPHAGGDTVTLRDGRPVLCRRAGPDDQEALLDLYAGLSEQSRATRFGCATPRLTGQLRRAITDLGRGPAWLALAGERCVGEARLVRSGCSDEAHAAVTIADDHQHRGLGNELGRLLWADPEAGQQPIVVTIQASNNSAVALARRFGFELRPHEGVLEGRLHPSPCLPTGGRRVLATIVGGPRLVRCGFGSS